MTVLAKVVWRVVHSRLRRGLPPRDQTKWPAAVLGRQRPGPPPFIALRVHYARKAARCFSFSVERRAATFIEVPPAPFAHWIGLHNG